MRYMLDTNICIYIIKNKPESVVKELKKHDPKEICISAITYAELIHGVEKSMAVDKNRLALTLLLSNIEVLDFDINAANNYGKIRTYLEKQVTPIGPLDIMIAAHAQSLGYSIVTNNIKEFMRVPNLEVCNWVKQA